MSARVSAVAEAGLLQTAPELVFLTDIAESRQFHVGTTRSESGQEPTDRPGSTDRHDGDLFEIEIASTSAGQRLDSHLIAGALDEDDGPHTPIVAAQHVAHRRNSLAEVLNGYSDPRCQTASREVLMADFDGGDSYRVLPPKPYESLGSYIESGGGKGLTAAGAVDAATIIEELVASGLRGRGGAGFPTGEKWRTIKSFASPLLRTSVVVNAAEGEPGTFKDRSIIRANPYAVIEGALIAALGDGSEVDRDRDQGGFRRGGDPSQVCAGARSSRPDGWATSRSRSWKGRPSTSTAKRRRCSKSSTVDLRSHASRRPFAGASWKWSSRRATPIPGADWPADVQMAGTEDDSPAPPVLVNNVETMANVPAIIAKGAKWFRTVGTTESPGTIVCTVTGDVEHPGVFEVPMGTPLRVAIDTAAGGVLARRQRGLGAGRRLERRADR